MRTLKRPKPDGQFVFDIGHGDYVEAVLYRDGMVFSAGMDGYFLVRDLNNRNLVPPVHTFEIYAMAWSPDQEQILLGTAGGLFQVEPKTGVMERLPDPEEEVAVRALDNDGKGRCAAGDDDGSIWTWGAGEKPGFLASLDLRIDELLFTSEPPGLLANDEAGDLHFLDLDTGKPVWQRTDLPAGEARATAVRGGNFILGGTGEDGLSGVLRLGDLTTGEFSVETTVPYAVTAATATEQGYITAHSDGSLYLWKETLTLAEKQATAHTMVIRDIYQHNGRIFTASADGTVRVTNPEIVLESIPSRVIAAGMNDKLTRVVTTDFNSVAIWDVKKCQRIHELPIPGIMAVTFGDGDQILTSDSQGNVQLREGEQLDVVKTGVSRLIPHTLGYFAGQVIGLSAENILDALSTDDLQRAMAFDMETLPFFRRLVREGAGFTAYGYTDDIELLFFRGETMVVRKGDQLIVPDAAIEYVRIWDGKQMQAP